MKIPYSEHSLTAGADLIDINGHMNSTHYGLIIYDAHDLFCCAVGYGPHYVAAYNCGTVVLESHLLYEREVFEGDKLEVKSWLLAVDHKRMHYFHELINVTQGVRAAASEQIDIHVDLAARKSVSIPKPIMNNLRNAVRESLNQKMPKGVGSILRPPENSWLL
jgi:acyl-CoA thioester hydrolase